MTIAPISFYKRSNVGDFLKHSPVNLGNPVTKFLAPGLAPTELMVYLKTTETCQLNCDHCFTSGINGRKIYFQPEKVIDWFHRLHEVTPSLNGGSIAFHGGEPMLAPISDMRKTWTACKDLWPNVWWTTTTNLVYNLDDEKREFFKECFAEGISTSWDKGIRFANQKQEDLWYKNVRLLQEDGHKLTLMISLSRSVLEMPVEDFLKWVIDLGVPYLHLERITPNGNAVDNKHIMPSNTELDAWFVKLWEASVKLETHKHFMNLFVNGVLSSFINASHSGCRCRSCEKKIFTLNADGTIGGCPNSAVNNTFGTLEDDIIELLSSEGRMGNIVCETQRNPLCYTCEVYDICNGDCHQLAWEGDICASPKSFMKMLKNSNDLSYYKTFLNGYQGAE
jgi:radical SAM protein with 4Fe4S-binding SPASM domain